MKVIDLLNKIANGEKTKSIDYKGESSLTYYLYDKCGRECDDTNLVNILNDEIEIIEEDKKIEHYYFSVFQDERLGGRQVVESLESKINEIIDKINKEK